MDIQADGVEVVSGGDAIVYAPGTWISFTGDNGTVSLFRGVLRLAQRWLTRCWSRIWCSDSSAYVSEFLYSGNSL